jgi:hypothetical protein
MPRGGYRPGAGSTKKKMQFSPGEIVEKVGTQMNKLSMDLISSRDARIRRWAWKQLLPYCYRKQPQAMELSGHLTAPEIIRDNIVQGKVIKNKKESM